MNELKETRKMLDKLVLRIEEGMSMLSLVSRHTNTNAITKQKESVDFSAVVGAIFFDPYSATVTYRYDMIELNSYKKMEGLGLVVTPSNLWFETLDKIVVQIAKEMDYQKIEVLADFQTSGQVKSAGYQRSLKHKKRFKYVKNIKEEE